MLDITDMEQTLNVQQIDVRLEGINATDLPFDSSRADKTWYDKYAIETKPLLVRSASGELYDDRRFKGIFVNDKYRRIVSRYYTVYPNEEVNEYLKDNAEKLNLELRKTYKSHFGDAMYWELLSKDIQDQVEYKGLNDVVKVGTVVRNSLGAGVALGADLYTWRVTCENGAVARGRDLSFALKHMGGDPEKLFEAFTTGIEKILAKSLELVEYYKKAAKLRMNKKIAQELAKRIPKRAFPSCMAYDYKTHTTTLLREDNLWEAFNDVTQKVWHNEKTGFLNKSGIEQKTHWILINAVQGRYT